MRSYLVRMFQPIEHVVEAETEEQALDKVAELYKLLYKKDLRTWIEPLLEPEDVQ
jgi:hypothetical protein